MKPNTTDISTAARRPSLTLDGDRGLRLVLPEGTPEALAMAAMRYFDDDMSVAPGMTVELPSFIEQARRIAPRFFVSPDAMFAILEERDSKRRDELMSRTPDTAIESLLRVPVYPYVLKGIRFAFRAGRAVIANGITDGNTLTAIGAAELLCRNGMADSVLIVCPTSLKYHWKNELERCADRQSVVIEGSHTGRRDRYRDKVVYKIVSYHTLANDVRAIGSQPFDCVIFDEIQRLSGWNKQIVRSIRHIEAEYCIALSGAGPDKVPEEVFSRCRILTLPTAEISGELPERTDATLPVPMTREQQEIHREAYSEAARLVGRWRQSRFLSEKERRRLLLAILRMQSVSNSTFLVDRTGRHDTKIGEALDIVRAAQGKTVIFCRQERMAGLMADELTRAGIDFAHIHGGLPRGKRTAATARFASGGCSVLLAVDSALSDINTDSARLIINLDQPWNADSIEQRIARVWHPGRRTKVRIIHMVSSGSIEERADSISRAGTPLPEFSEAQITIGDRDLDILAGMFAYGNDTTDNCDIAIDGIRFLSSLAETLATPESTERLLDTIVVENTATGRQELRIPVDNRDQIANILYSISRIFAPSKR